MPNTNLWAKRLGNGAAVGGFTAVMAASLLHKGFNEWAISVDVAVFGAETSRFHPTLALISAVLALFFGGIGYLTGRFIDRRQ